MRAPARLRTATIQALLESLANFGDSGATAQEFAEKTYAGSKFWRTPPRRGTQRSGKVVRAAAGVLGKLRVLGYVEHIGDRWFLAANGGRFLNDPPPAKLVPNTWIAEQGAP